MGFNHKYERPFRNLKSEYLSRKPICRGGRKPTEVFQIISEMLAFGMDV